MSAIALETALMVRVEQITGGEQTCEIEGCDQSAVLVVVTEPDGEPGVVCAPHGLEWVGMITRVIEGIWQRRGDNAA